MWKTIYQKKDKWSNVGRFPGKGGESLGLLKYQAFPSQILSFKTFTNLLLSNSLRAQSRMKTQFYARKTKCKAIKQAKQENTQLKTCYLENFKLDVS